jgi:hypothetical protein
MRATTSLTSSAASARTRRTHNSGQSSAVGNQIGITLPPY